MSTIMMAMVDLVGALDDRWLWKPLHLIGGGHDDVALDDVVEPLLEIGLVDAYSMMVACLMVESHDGDIDVIWSLGDG